MSDEIATSSKTVLKRKRKNKKKTTVFSRALRDIVDITLGAVLTYFGCNF